MEIERLLEERFGIVAVRAGDDSRDVVVIF